MVSKCMGEVCDPHDSSYAVKQISILSEKSPFQRTKFDNNILVNIEPNSDCNISQKCHKKNIFLHVWKALVLRIFSQNLFFKANFAERFKLLLHKYF